MDEQELVALKERIANLESKIASDLGSGRGDGNVPRQLSDLDGRIGDVRSKIAEVLKVTKESDSKLKDSIQEQLTRMDDRASRGESVVAMFQKEFADLRVSTGKTESLVAKLQETVNELAKSSSDSKSVREGLVKSVDELERLAKSSVDWKAAVDTAIREVHNHSRLLTPPPETKELPYIDVRRELGKITGRITDGQNLLKLLSGGGAAVFLGLFGFTKIDGNNALKEYEARIAANRTQIIQLQQETAVKNTELANLKAEVDRLRGK